LRLHNKKKKDKKEIEENIIPEVKKEKKRSTLINFYDKNYAKLLIIPIVLLLLSFLVIGLQIANTGDFVHKSVSLKGGTTITIQITANVNVDNLEAALASEFYPSDVSVRALSKAGTQTGIIIDTDLKGDEIDPLISSLEEKIGDLGDYNTEQMGSSLGESFFKETLIALLLAFLFMGIVVFIYFKNFVPSLAVIGAAFSDLVITLAIIDLMGLRLSTAGIAAFLMLIGYSVDTDILLTTRLVKRKKGTVIERLLSAMKTGLTMSATTIAVVTLALIFSQSDTIRQIMIILLIGLLVDLVSTWIQNAGILRLHLAKKNE
jgi:preprotein translocase subunit SecF